MRSSLVHRFVALLLASNYFTFQIEPFEEEYEANHPDIPDGWALSQPTLTWESFDKQNAPKAFVFDAVINIELLHLLTSPPVKELPANPQYQPVRDKSPPAP
jgi:hypothetical protein